jgi:hypothetical protein
MGSGYAASPTAAQVRSAPHSTETHPSALMKCLEFPHALSPQQTRLGKTLLVSSFLTAQLANFAFQLHLTPCLDCLTAQRLSRLEPFPPCLGTHCALHT